MLEDQNFNQNHLPSPITNTLNLHILNIKITLLAIVVEVIVKNIEDLLENLDLHLVSFPNLIIAQDNMTDNHIISFLKLRS